jgi:hypothetical protein
MMPSFLLLAAELAAWSGVLAVWSGLLAVWSGLRREHWTGMLPNLKGKPPLQLAALTLSPPPDSDF